MSRKSFSFFIVIDILMIFTSFVSGIFYERQIEDKNTLDIDPSLVLLLANPSDFEITDGEWANRNYNQTYINPSSSLSHYVSARNSFTVSFPKTNKWMGLEHLILRYELGKTPKTIWIDDIYSSKRNSTEWEIHLLNFKELDRNSLAFCITSEARMITTCYFESKHDEIISVFSVWSSNMEETQLINFLMPAVQKFYDRLSKSSIK